MSEQSFAPRPSAPVLRLAGVRKSFNIGTTLETEVLHGIDLQLERGELAALIGPSGSGKSTLLNIIGLLDTPTEGELYLLGQPTATADDTTRTHMRNQAIGFVFQFHHLISAFSVLDNVLMPLMIRQGKPGREQIELARELLDQVGLERFAEQKPTQLSGGQQQPGAIELFHRINDEFGCAILVVTHDPRLAEACPRTVELVDGQIIRDGTSAPLR